MASYFSSNFFGTYLFRWFVANFIGHFIIVPFVLSIVQDTKERTIFSAEQNGRKKSIFFGLSLLIIGVIQFIPLWYGDSHNLEYLQYGATSIREVVYFISIPIIIVDGILFGSIGFTTSILLFSYFSVLAIVLSIGSFNSSELYLADSSLESSYTLFSDNSNMIDRVIFSELTHFQILVISILFIR